MLSPRGRPISRKEQAALAKLPPRHVQFASFPRSYLIALTREMAYNQATHDFGWKVHQNFTVLEFERGNIDEGDDHGEIVRWLTEDVFRIARSKLWIKPASLYLGWRWYERDDAHIFKQMMETGYLKGTEMRR